MSPPRRHGPPAITFGQIAETTYMIKIACKCGRAGQYRVDRLIEKLGPEATILNWVAQVSADCPKRNNPANLYYDRCDPLCTLVPYPADAQPGKPD